MKDSGSSGIIELSLKKKRRHPTVLPENDEIKETETEQGPSRKRLNESTEGDEKVSDSEQPFCKATSRRKNKKIAAAAAADQEAAAALATPAAPISTAEGTPAIQKTFLPAGSDLTRSPPIILICFYNFIDDSMFEMIVENTNLYISHMQEKFGRARDARTNDICEMKAFVGILYLAGVLKSGRQNVLSLWNTDGMGIMHINLTMSYNLIRFICRCIRFDNMNSREKRRNLDKLATK
ncbi:hypothetical protein JTB14_000775 [Gonioctena quinquepunctata]|nr:hypothetical protein JTB14_000775 [Gonioctena quinquepunctata]